MKKKSVLRVIATVLLVCSSASAVAAEGSPSFFGRLFGSNEGVDMSIPPYYRRSFSTSRNQVVMVFQRTYWRSLTNKAAKGSIWQQQNFCDLLTRSDQAARRIPRGFRYETTGDGRIYLLKASDYAQSTGLVSLQ